MTVPLDMMNDIRSIDAGGVPRAEIARRLGVSRNTVAKYADIEDMSSAAPIPAPVEACPRRARGAGRVRARVGPGGAAQAAPHRQEGLRPARWRARLRGVLLDDEALVTATLK